MVACRSAKLAQILRYFRGAKGDKGLSATGAVEGDSPILADTKSGQSIPPADYARG